MPGPYKMYVLPQNDGRYWIAVSFIFQRWGLAAPVNTRGSFTFFDGDGLPDKEVSPTSPSISIVVKIRGMSASPPANSTHYLSLGNFPVRVFDAKSVLW